MGLHSLLCFVENMDYHSHLQSLRYRVFWEAGRYMWGGKEPCQIADERDSPCVLFAVEN